MEVRETIEAWLSGGVVEISVRECPTCEQRLDDDDLYCPDCDEEAVEITEYIPVDWKLG